MEWPNHFPEGCPPDDADDAHGTVVRLVRGNPPTPEDFQSQYEGNPRRSWGDDRCRACGLSVFQDPEDARAISRRIPAFRNRHIATADLEPAMGRLKHTPSKHEPTHHTWWLPTNVNVAELFAVVGES